ncbi:uncharacterized protein LOC125653378 isoform X2 [Ostrea edulis]|uniref:uncharacterized protein LOC125653378 isoform X2 n=1 Tax=Ostrea edulis TaxID=37623 RepID=UPI0024AF500A|nr:uncharacterized protein LOC125653378 isoform X2 [Ostrea edulis]
MLFLFCLSVLFTIAEACDKPTCSVQSPAATDCQVQTQDLNEAETGLCSRYITLKQTDLTYYRASEKSYMNGSFALKVRKGGIQNYKNLMIEVRPREMTQKYLIRIGVRAEMEKENIKVSVSCLEIVKEDSVSVGIAGELIEFGQQCRPKYRKYQAVVRAIVPPSSSSTKPSQLKGSTKEHTDIGEDRCSIDLQKKTMTHRWKKLENIRIQNCLFMGKYKKITPGNWTENNGIIYCVAKYNFPNEYYSRIYYHDLTTRERFFLKPCHFNITTLDPSTKMNVTGNAVPSVAAVLETSYTTPIVVGSILFFGSVLLLSLIATLFYRRKRICIDAALYPSTKMNVTGNESSKATAMIITVDEYNKDISQLTSLLKDPNINTVSVESSFKDNMMSRHDWLERAVSDSNHYIFIVTKQMGDIFKTKFNEPLSGESGDRVRLLTEYEGGTCAYTVNLIRNEFIKSLVYTGYSVKSCHLVSFEEEDEKVVSRLKDRFKLFQCVKTHCYHLYTGGRFRYNAACRIINNIKKT